KSTGKRSSRLGKWQRAEWRPAVACGSPLNQSTLLPYCLLPRSVGDMNFVINALYSPFFWGYTVTVAVLLTASWGALFWYQRRGQPLDEYRRVFWSWLLFAGLVTSAVLLGQEIFSLVVAFVALFACKEFARATGLYDDWIFTGLVYLAILAVNFVAVWPGYDVFMATPI